MKPHVVPHHAGTAVSGLAMANSKTDKSTSRASIIWRAGVSVERRDVSVILAESFHLHNLRGHNTFRAVFVLLT